MPILPLPSLHKRNNPTSTMVSKTMSVMTRTMMLSLLTSELSTTHCRRVSCQSARSCRMISLERSQYWGLLIHPRST